MKHLRLIVMATVILGITWSCQQEEELTLQSEDHTFLSESEMVGMTKLGKQLENPYSIENMKKALESLKASNPNGQTSEEEIEITTTHLYVRFKPKNEEELDILKSDSTLILYDFPLDYEIAETGDFYHDPEIPIDQPTYQYCAIEVEKEIPIGVEYELLAELFIPDEDSDEDDEENASGRIASSDFIDALVDRSLVLTGNLTEKDVSTGEYSNARISKWRPAGRVRVWDENIGTTTLRRRIFSHWEYYDCGEDDPSLYGEGSLISVQQCQRAAYRYETVEVDGRHVPVVGIEVRARRWFTTYEGITNTEGRYSCNGRFRRDANYSIKWERYQYSIRSGTFGQAKLDGPKRRGDWNVNIGNANTSNTVLDRQQYYALIHQAAYDYYYRNVFGLSSPPRNSFLRPQTKIAADITERQNRKPSHAAIYARATGGILPTIYIRTWNDNADRVYAVTAHELAHYSHWDLDRGAFTNLVGGAYNASDEGDEAVIESWASGVEWQFAQQRYRNLFGIGGYEYENNRRIGNVSNGNYQAQTISGYPIYTSIVVDMIDNENQRFTTGGGRVDIPIDMVDGYTIQQIEHGLRGARSWNQWRDNMRNRHVNAIENRLNELFANWH